MAISEHPMHIDIDDKTCLWRYLSVEKFELMMRDKALFFCRADKFEDPYEGSLPVKEKQHRVYQTYEILKMHGKSKTMDEVEQEDDEIHKSFAKRLKRSTLMNCWHINNGESDAMWKLYMDNYLGIAIKSNVARLKTAIQKVVEQIGFSKVRYIDYENDIWFHEIDYPSTSLNIRTPYVHKRKEFQHEQEFRLILENTDSMDNKDYWKDRVGQNVNVDIVTVIEEVILPPTADKEFVREIETMISDFGYHFPVRFSKMRNEAIF